MTHISAIESTFGLFEHGLSYIKPNGLLYLYGPFNKISNSPEGNRAFHIHSSKIQTGAFETLKILFSLLKMLAGP